MVPIWCCSTSLVRIWQICNNSIVQEFFTCSCIVAQSALLLPPRLKKCKVLTFSKEVCNTYIELIAHSQTSLINLESGNPTDFLGSVSQKNIFAKEFPPKSLDVKSSESRRQTVREVGAAGSGRFQCSMYGRPGLEGLAAACLPPDSWAR